MVKLNRLELIKLIQEMVSFPSVSSGNDLIKEELLNYIEIQFQSVGLQTYKYFVEGKPSMLIHHPDKKDYNFSLLLHGHIDVVHAESNQFKITKDDKYLYGRGVLDMKSSIAVYVLLLRNLFLSNNMPENIGLMLTSDEEQGGILGTKYLFEKEKVNAKFFITGEPTDLHIVNRHKGVWRTAITVFGKSTHSSTPWLGDNSLHKTSKYLSHFLDNHDSIRKDNWHSSYSFNRLESGDSINKVPDTATVWIDIRYTNEPELNELIKSLKDIFNNAKFNILFSSPPLETHAGDESITLLNSKIEEIVGFKSQIQAKEYATDARYASLMNIPSIVFGPSGSGIHESDERVEINSLVKYYSILWNFCNEFD